MQAFHIPAPPPYYTNTFLLISDVGHAVIIDPAADVQNYEQILQEHNAVLTTLLCTHGHFDHVGSAEALRRKYHAVLYCEADDLAAHPAGDPGAARPRRVFHLRGGTGQQLLHPQRPARQC